MFFRSGYRQMCIIFKRRCIQDRDVEGVRFFMEGRRDWKRFLPIIRNAPFDLSACMRWFIKLLLLFEKITGGKRCSVYVCFSLPTLRPRCCVPLLLCAVTSKGFAQNFPPDSLFVWQLFFSGKISVDKLDIASLFHGSRWFNRLLV